MENLGYPFTQLEFDSWAEIVLRLVFLFEYVDVNKNSPGKFSKDITWNLEVTYNFDRHQQPQNHQKPSDSKPQTNPIEKIGES